MTNQSFSITNAIEREFTQDVNLMKDAYTRDSASRDNQNGTGLGLSIVDTIAKQHDYSLTLRSENLTYTATLQI